MGVARRILDRLLYRTAPTVDHIDGHLHAELERARRLGLTVSSGHRDRPRQNPLGVSDHWPHPKRRTP